MGAGGHSHGGGGVGGAGVPQLGVGGQMALQAAGMLTGSLIMLLIAIYEHDLHDILSQAF